MWIILVQLLGAALVGAAIGWLLSSKKNQEVSLQYEKKITTLQQDIEAVSKAKNVVEKESKNLNKNILELQNELATSQNKIVLLEKEIPKYEATLDSVRLETKELEQTILVKREESEELVQMLEQLKTANSEKTTFVEKLEQQITDLEEQYKKEKHSTNEKYEDLEKEYKFYQANESDRTSQLKELESTCKTEIKALKEQLEDQALELSTWNKQYAQMKEERDRIAKNYQLLEMTTKMDIAAIQKEKEQLQKLLD